MSNFESYSVRQIREIKERHQNDRIETLVERKIRLALEAKVAICEAELLREVQSIIVADYLHKQRDFSSSLKIVEFHPKIDLLEEIENQIAYYVLNNDVIQSAVKVIDAVFSSKHRDTFIKMIAAQVKISGLKNVNITDIRSRLEPSNDAHSDRISKKNNPVRKNKALELSKIFPKVRQISSFSPGLHIVGRIYENAFSLNEDKFSHYEKCLFALCKAYVSSESYTKLKESFESVDSSLSAFERRDLVLAYHASMVHDSYIFGQYSVAENFSTLFELLSPNASKHSALIFPHADSRRIKALAEVTVGENALNLSVADLARRLRPIANAGRVFDLNTLPKISQKEAYISLGVMHMQGFGDVDFENSQRRYTFQAFEGLGVDPNEQRRILAQVEGNSSSAYALAIPSGGSFPSVAELKIQKAGMALNFGAHMLAIGAGSAVFITTAIPDAIAVGGVAAAIGGVGFTYKQIYDVTSTAADWAKDFRSDLNRLNDDLEIAESIDDVEEYSEKDNALLSNSEDRNNSESDVREQISDNPSQNGGSSSQNGDSPSQNGGTDGVQDDDERIIKPDAKEKLKELDLFGTSVNPYFYDVLPSIEEILFKGYLKMCTDWIGLIRTTPGEELAAEHHPIIVFGDHGHLIKVLPLILYFDPLEVRLDEHKKLFLKPRMIHQYDDPDNPPDDNDPDNPPDDNDPDNPSDDNDPDNPSDDNDPDNPSEDSEQVYIGGRKYHVSSFQAMNAPLVLFVNGPP
ncbi:MAG: hypothetical protein ABJP06_11920 [Sulfitobacter sp.]